MGTVPIKKLPGPPPGNVSQAPDRLMRAPIRYHADSQPVDVGGTGGPQDQRCVPLKFRVFNDSSLRVSAPANGNVAPPGYYMLFIISRDGVPSMARYVHVRRLPSVSVP